MFNSTESNGTRKAIADSHQSQPRADSADSLAPHGEVADIDLHLLRPGTELRVDTRNSQYRILMLDGNDCHALVRGGRYFAQETEARIDGSAIVGNIIKLGWICLGQCMELSVHGKRLITSRVRSINVVPCEVNN